MKDDSKSKLSYEKLWKLIIRPDKDTYKPKDLGNKVFTFKGKTYIRKDYNLISSEGYLMKCSFIELDYSDRPKKIMPVILYLHGNSSSRLEGMGMLPEILKRDINLFVIDFPGCGQSEGEYISLGYHESHDVNIVVDFINKLPGVGNIGIWGRSMGAATTMIYAHKDNRIKALVMDSPFADFNILAKDIVLQQIKLPNFLIEGALKIVRMTIRKKNGLDIEKLKPIDSAPKTKQPAIFIHANSDELINNKHSDMLFKVYGGKDKKLLKCVGNHNTRRSNKIIREIGEFFYNHLVNEGCLNNNNNDKNNIFNLDNFENTDNSNEKKNDIKKNENENENNNINTENNIDNSQKDKENKEDKEKEKEKEEKDKNEIILNNEKKQEIKEESKVDNKISEDIKDVNEIKENK